MAKKTILTENNYSREEVESILKQLDPKVVIDKNLQPEQVTSKLETHEWMISDMIEEHNKQRKTIIEVLNKTESDIVLAKVDSGLGVLTAVLGSIAIYMAAVFANNIYYSTVLVLIGVGLLFGTAWLWTKK